MSGLLQTQMKQKVWTVANFFSFARILVSPVIYYSLSTGNRWLSFFVILFGGFSDVADGFIARKLNQVSEFGAKLDSFADFIYYGCFLFVFWVVYASESKVYEMLMVLSIIFLACAYVITFFRFKKFASFHLLSMKFSAFIAYAAIIYSLLFNLNLVFIKISLIAWFIACFETFVASILIKKIVYNLKSVFLR